MNPLALLQRRNGHNTHELMRAQSLIPVDLDAELARTADEFVHKPRTRTYETVFRQYVENRESINSTIDLLRQQCALEETLISELDALMAIAKTEHEDKLKEIATVEASIPRAATPEGQ